MFVWPRNPLPTVVKLPDEPLPPEVAKLSLENYTAALAGEPREFEFASDGLNFVVRAEPIVGEEAAGAGAPVSLVR